MATFISKSPQETFELGRAWAQEVKAGWTLGLVGDLGAGKTCLVKGLAEGLGFHGRVQSPTFGLVNQYLGGRLPITHMDLYRLDTPAQIVGAGLEELLDPKSVVIIEWADRWFKQPREYPVPYRHVIIEGSSDSGRTILYEDFGH